MKKLKIILLFSIILYVYFVISNERYYSKYKNETEIIGIVNKINVKDNYTKMELIGKEKIICTIYDKVDIELGTKIKMNGELTKPNINTNFNLFNYKKYLLSKKIYWIFKADNIQVINNKIKIKYQIKNKIINRINEYKNSDYLKLFILGENDLEENIKSNYQSLGISHLFAVSGMHITLLTSIILKIINKLSNNKKFNLMIVTLFLLFYMFLTNYSSSVIRASLLFILLNIKEIFKINIKTDNLLFLVSIILLIYNPYYIYDLGFLFSFIISYFLIINNKLLNKKYIFKILLTSLIAFLASIPIMIYGFNQVNLISIFVNIIFVPFVSLIIFPLSLLAFIFPFVEFILTFNISLLEFISSFLSKFNVIIIIPNLPLYILLLYYIFIYRFKYYKIIVVLLFILISSNIKYFINYPIVTILDVGQGDSSLIELPHNINILIDTGGKVSFDGINKNEVAKNILIPYLKSVGINKIDYLILTHGDYDHMGDSIYLVNNYKVKNVIFNCGEFNDLEKDLIKVLDNKKINYKTCVKNIDKNNLYFLNDEIYENENDNSIVLYTELSNYKFLFMGDASKKTEKDIMNNYNLGKIDVIKIGHHGSKTSSTKEFIDEIEPKYSVISVGKNNRYGHPNDEVLDALNNTKIYRTDIDGSVMFKIKNNKLDVNTCPP